MIHLSLYKIILIILAFLSTLLFAYRVRNKRSTIPTLILWILFCIVIILIAIFPGFTDVVANIFGLNRGLDFIIILGFAFCIFTIFKLYIKVDNMNQSLSDLVRELAIEKEKNEYLEKLNKDSKE